QKLFKIDNLYRNAGAIQGANILPLTHTEKGMSYDFRSQSYVEKTKTIATARYVGTGICAIEISAPGDMIDARVHARSQVTKLGGSVTVSVVSDLRDTQPKILYT